MAGGQWDAAAVAQAVGGGGEGREGAGGGWRSRNGGEREGGRLRSMLGR